MRHLFVIHQMFQTSECLALQYFQCRVQYEE